MLFEAGSAEIRPEHAESISSMVAALNQYRGGQVNIVGHAEEQALALRRAEALRDALLEGVEPSYRADVVINLTPEAGTTLALAGEHVRLGEVLFVTDQAQVREQYLPLMSDLAALFRQRLASGQQTLGINIVGHADRRGSVAYNQALGMRRARAVFDAIASQLTADERSRLRVEFVDDASPRSGEVR